MIITNHAKEKYKKITGCKNLARAEKSLIKVFGMAKQARRVNAAWAIIRNGFEAADYYKYETWIFVVKDGKIITCYQLTQKDKFVEV